MALKKAMFFSIDAIIGAGILLGTLLIITNFYVSEQQTTRLNYMSQDIIEVLNELKIDEIDSSYISSLISSGIITEEENSVIEQLGEFWTNNLIDEARNLSAELLTGLVEAQYGLGIYIDSTELYSINTSTHLTLTSSSKIISGIEENKTASGFVARATASEISKNTTDVYVFNPEGSSNDPGNHEIITKKFYINYTDINSAKWYASIHWGTSSISSDYFAINSQSVNFNWTYQEKYENTWRGFGEADIMGKIQQGWNTVTIDLIGQNAGHTHLNPGGRIEITYEDNLTYSPLELETHRYYFDNLYNQKKNGGAWAVYPIFIPKYVILKDITFNLKATGVKDDASKNNDVQVYLNDYLIDIIPNPSSTVEKTYNLTSNISSTGMYVLTVYINCFGDEFWGEAGTTLFSNPETAPESSTYLEITYENTPLSGRYVYGMVDIGKVDLIAGEKNTTKTFSKDLESFDILESFIELAALESEDVSIYVNDNLAFNSPTPLATPTRIAIDNSYLDINSTNFFNITDVCEYCFILPQTAYHYRSLVPFAVGYGETFNTLSEAEDDAKSRLQNLISEYLDALEINNASMTLGSVPSLWGPAIFEVRIWQ